MLHETEKKAGVKITNGLYSFDDIYDKPYTAKDLLDEIKKADILLIPIEGFNGRDDYLFPEYTREFYEYLIDAVNDKDIKADICVSDEDYKSLELHAEVITITWIIVKFIALPIITSVIAGFLYDKMKRHNKKDISTDVKITVEHKGKTKTVHYEGSALHFEDAMKSIDKSIFK